MKLSNKIVYIWLLFGLFVYVCIFKDPTTVGIVAGVVTITVNWLFRLRTKEKIAGVNGYDTSSKQG